MRLIKSVEFDSEVKLDLKDKKILHYISEDARMPYTQIAKKVMLSKDAVKYRMNNLEKKGVIQGYMSVVDIAKIGYDSYHILLQLNKINKEIRSELVKVFKSYPFVKVVLEFSGKYDFEIGIAVRNLKELDMIVTKIIGDVDKCIQSYEILTLVKTYEGRIFPESFLNIKEKTELKKESDVKVDGTDLKILGKLSLDSTISLYDVGKVVGLTSEAVNYRIKNLKKQGVIKRFAPMINHHVLGYTVYGLLINVNNLDGKKEAKLKEFLHINKNVLWAVKCIGKYNLFAYICVKKSDDLHQTISDLRELFSSDIKEYETMVAYQVYEYNYFPEVCKTF
ncbi:MAG: Lrp/AsnC family transcriptional regulator [archaeon]